MPEAKLASVKFIERQVGDGDLSTRDSINVLHSQDEAEEGLAHVQKASGVTDVGPERDEDCAVDPAPAKVSGEAREVAEGDRSFRHHSCSLDGDQMDAKLADRLADAALRTSGGERVFTFAVPRAEQLPVMAAAFARRGCPVRSLPERLIVEVTLPAPD